VNIVTISRRIRAVSGIAATWGVAFAALGATAFLGALAFKVLPPELGGVRLLVPIIIRGFIGGAVAGTVFATVFAGAERNRTLATLSARRVALWGFIGAAVPTAITLGLGAARLVPIGVMGAACIAYGLIGASLATVMVRVARRAPASAIAEGALPY
jgi:hypothetical protein